MSEEECTRICKSCSNPFEKSDGRGFLCRECFRVKRKEYDQRYQESHQVLPDESTKRCVNCNIEYPATKKYFHGKSAHPGGLNPRCKICRARSASGYRLAVKRLTGEELPRVCTSCGVTKLAIEFPATNSNKGWRSSWCRGCHLVNGSRWYDENKERYLRKQYGITLYEYEDMLKRQGGACATCGKREADNAGRALHVDHAHKTGRIRGLLCGNCNRAVGMLRDDPEIVRRVFWYLMDS